MPRRKSRERLARAIEVEHLYGWDIPAQALIAEFEHDRVTHDARSRGVVEHLQRFVRGDVN